MGCPLRARAPRQGANLNRCWGGLHPELGKGAVPAGQTTPPAPETSAAIAAMEALGGVDLMFDVHQV
jgi:hypothetical protein